MNLLAEFMIMVTLSRSPAIAAQLEDRFRNKNRPKSCCSFDVLSMIDHIWRSCPTIFGCIRKLYFLSHSPEGREADTCLSLWVRTLFQQQLYHLKWKFKGDLFYLCMQQKTMGNRHYSINGINRIDIDEINHLYISLLPGPAC